MKKSNAQFKRCPANGHTGHWKPKKHIEKTDELFVAWRMTNGISAGKKTDLLCKNKQDFMLTLSLHARQYLRWGFRGENRGAFAPATFTTKYQLTMQN